MKSSSVVVWADLPYDIVALIANKLLSLKDFLSFSAVCRSWRLVYLKKDWSLGHDHIIPWLMLYEYHELEMPKRLFFDVMGCKFHKLSLPEVRNCQCWGTPHGWIVTFDQGLSVKLLNPVTRFSVDLPPFPSLRREVHAENWFSAIQKAAVVKRLDSFLIMVIHGFNRHLSYAKPEGTGWVEFPIAVPLSQVICFKDQILALTVAGRLLLLDIDGPHSPRAIYVASPPANETGWLQLNLVISSGNLLLVLRYYVEQFKVYKFDISSGKWMVCEDLGANCLLMDNYDCTSVPACGSLKPNCIYSAKDNLNSLLTYGHNQGAFTMVQFSLQDKKAISWRLAVNNVFRYTCPVWVLLGLWHD